jgi:hypothetical protein
MPRIARLNYQPSLNSPLVHLSGATAQQELSEAVNDLPARNPVQVIKKFCFGFRFETAASRGCHPGVFQI